MSICLIYLVLLQGLRDSFTIGQCYLDDMTAIRPVARYRFGCGIDVRDGAIPIFSGQLIELVEIHTIVYLVIKAACLKAVLYRPRCHRSLIPFVLDSGFSLPRPMKNKYGPAAHYEQPYYEQHWGYDAHFFFGEQRFCHIPIIARTVTLSYIWTAAEGSSSQAEV